MRLIAVYKLGIYLVTRGMCANFWSYYFTASLSAFAARNFGTRIAGTSIDSPVRGLRAVRAFRIFAEKIPRPAIDTSVPHVLHLLW